MEKNNNIISFMCQTGKAYLRVGSIDAISFHFYGIKIRNCNLTAYQFDGVTFFPAFSHPRAPVEKE